jgi:excisionase family DNA binding protein
MKLIEVGKILRVHGQTIKRKIKSGQLKAKIVNRHWDITSEDLQEYLNKYDTNSR